MTAVTKLISSTKLPSSKGPVKLTPDQVKYPARPGFGTKGRACMLYTNHMQMAVTGSVTLYRYDIGFPEDKRPKGQVEPKGKKRRRLVELLIEDHLNDKSYSLASDYSAILISKTKLPIEPDGTLFSIVYRGDNEDKPDPNAKPDPDAKPAPTYHLLLQLTQDHSISEIINSITSTNVGDILSDRRLEIIQSLNIIMGSYAKANTNIASIGPNRHYMLNPAAEDTWSIPNGLVALRGFFFSVRAASAQLLLNVQVKSAAFYQSGPLDVVMLNFLGGRRVSDAVTELARFVNGLSIYVTHLPVKKNKAGQPIRRIKKIHGLAAKGDGRGNKDKEPPKVDAFGATASQVQFFQKPPEGKQGNGNWVTVRKYFDKEYKKQINWNRIDLPVINVGNAQNPSYLPAEVCVVVPGQQVNAMLKGPQTEGMRSQAVRQPAWNAKSIVGAGARTLGLNDQANKVLAAFGISINTNLITVEARVLPAPRPLYRGGKAPSKVANGGWNMANIKSYRNGVLPGGKCTGLEFDCQPGFLTNHIREGGMLGFIQEHQLTWMDAPNQCNLRSGDPEAAIEKWAQAAYRAGVRVLIVLLPLQDTNMVFNMVKRVCDITMGIHSVCVRHDKVRTLQAPRSVQYWANVDLKLNLRLGGVVSVFLS
jgi:eukaryotic translation initiation factor 2C